MELFKLWGSISIKDEQAKKKLEEVDNKAAKTSGRMGGMFSKAGGAMGAAVAAGAAAAGAALVALGGVIGKVGFDYNSMMENSAVAWETLLGTQDKAKKMLEDIGKFAKNTQFETDQVDMMAKYMHNAGLEGKSLFDELTKVADISGAFNIPAHEAEELTRQMSQVRQAGLAYTEDLNVLQDRGIPIYKAIAEEVGINVAEVKKMASEGKLTSDIYLKAFDKVAKGVEGSADKQSKTFSGMISTLKDNLKMISGELTKGAFERFKGVLSFIMPIIERFSSTLKDEGLKEALKTFLPASLVDGLFTLGEGIAKVRDLVVDFVTKAYENSSQYFPIIKEVVSTAFSAIKEVALTLWDFFKKNILPIFLDLYNWIQGHMPTIRATVVTVFTKIREVVRNAWAFFKENLLPILASVYGWVQAHMPQIKSIIETAFTVIKNVVQIAWGIFENLLLPVLKKLWEWIEPHIPKIKETISKAFEGIVKAVELGVDIFEKVSGAIKKAVDWLDKWNNKDAKKKTVTVEEKRVASGGIAGGIRNIPQYATGTNFHPGGAAIVGERGPELLNLPKGSKVSTASETKQLFQQSEPKQPIILQMVLNSKVIAEETYEDISVLMHKANKMTARKGGVVFGN